MDLTVEVVRRAIANRSYRYASRAGRLLSGERVSNVSATLRSAGWRKVPRLDTGDLEALGCEVARAQYVGGAHPTGQFVDVVVLEWLKEEGD